MHPSRGISEPDGSLSAMESTKMYRDLGIRARPVHVRGYDVSDLRGVLK